MLDKALTRAELSFPVSYSGNQSLLEIPVKIGMIGTRKASESSLKVIRKLAGNLAKANSLIVSGGAIGTDLSAHEGAVQSGANTLFVLPCGVGTFLENEYDKLLSLSPEPDETQFFLFSPFRKAEQTNVSSPVIRNRLIATLSDVMVVGEMGPSGGTHHCVNFALYLGLPIYFLSDGADSSLPVVKSYHATMKSRGAIAFTSNDCMASELCDDIITKAKDYRAKLINFEKAQLNLFQP